MMRHPSTDNVHHNTKENTMKPTRNILFGFVVASATLIAGSVTIPNSFTANTTAKASEVNANFSAVKTAIDGNAGDIATNKSNISDNANDIATNKADIADAVTSISAGAGLDINRTDGNVTIKKKSGYVAVHGSAFNSLWEDASSCILLRDWYASNVIGTYFLSTSNANDCDAFANVNIPYGATITKLTCRVLHNVAGNLHVRLYMQNLANDGLTMQKESLVDASFTAGNQLAATQEIYGTPSFSLNANGDYQSYFIEWDPPATNSSGANERLYDCKVDYEY